ncbi:MAG: autotransporter-associated beta strand repeat-containing protein, partial [Chthoniobacter sp.]|nr:autotransporter-associated beta strand repeat-containing protein [Chthoniobacter sp.]
MNLTGALVTATNNDAFLTNVAGITFNGVSYSIGGSAFTLNGSVNTTGAATISANVTLGVGGGIIVTNAASSLDFTGTFNAGSQALDFSGAGNVTFVNAISNGTILAKSGAGTLTLAGTNGFSDLTTSGGIITGGAITLSGGATALTGNASGTILSDVTLTTAPGTITSNAGTLTLGGTLDAGSMALTIAGTGNLTLSNAIANGTTLNKADTGTLTLTGTNNFTSANFDLGTTSGGTLVLSGGATAITGGVANRTVNSNVTISGAAGTITSAAGTLTLGGTLDAGSLALTFDGAGNTTVSNAIANGTTLTKNGTGTLTLSSGSGYTGATAITNGVVNIRNATSLGTVAGGVTVSAGAALQIQNNITVGNEALTLNGTGVSSDGALRNISGNNIWQGTVTLASATQINSDSGSLTFNTATTSITGVNQNLTLGGASGGTVSGLLTLGSGSLTKEGGGTWTLLGLPTYTGGTTINGGNLYLRTDTFAPNGALYNIGNVTVASGASLTGERANLAGTTLTLNGGTWFENNGFGGSWTGAVVLGATSIISSGFNQQITGNITGAGGLTKQGGGTLTIRGAGTHLGTTTISAGTLQLGTGNAGQNGTISGAITDNATLTFNNGSPQTHSGAIGGSGAVNKSGFGTLTMSVANTYTGLTTVTGGVLSLNDTAALPGGIDATVGVGESALTLNGGVIGLTTTSGDFLRDVGAGAGQVQWANGGTGGFTAYGGDRAVNLGGASAVLTWNSAGTFGSAGLILSSFDSDSKVTFQNPVDLNGAVRTITAANGTAAVDGEMSGILSGAAGGINKAGAGTLALSADNTYAGATTIAQGILKLGAAGGATDTPLGTVAGSTTVSATGAALDVGGFTLGTAESLTLNGSGINNNGALTNSGSAATYSGAITLNAASNIGSTSGKLTITGGISGAQALTFSGSGDTTVSTVAINANVTVVTKIGSGNLTMDVASGSFTAPVSVNNGTFTLSGAAVLGNVSSTISMATLQANRTDQTLTSATLPAGFQVGSFVLGQMVQRVSGTGLNISGGPNTTTTGAVAYTSGVQALGGGALVLDNSGTNVNNRFGGRAIGLGASTLSLTPSNLATGTGMVTETIGGLVLMMGHSVITLTADTLTDATPATENQTNFTAASLNARFVGNSALIRGTNLGNAAANGVSTFTFTAAPTFIGITTAGGTSTTQGILPWVIVDSSATGLGTSFATTTGAAQRLRPLTAGEMSAGSAYTNASNALLAGAQPALTANTTVNSLTITSGNVTMTNPAFPAAVPVLTITSGGLLSTTAASNISGGVLSWGNGQLDVFTPGATAGANILTVSSRVSGQGLVKAGGGTLVLSSVSPAYAGFSQNAVTGGLGVHNGSVYLNEGTTQLNTHNAIGNGGATGGTNDGNLLNVAYGATLNLNGRTQFVGPVTSQLFLQNTGENLLDVRGGTITSSTTASLVAYVGNPGGGNPGPFSFGGSITGSVGFALGSEGTWGQAFTGANNYSGPTLVYGGASGVTSASGLTLKDGGTISGTSRVDINYQGSVLLDNTGLSNNTDRVNNAADIGMNGGTLTFFGRAQTISTETLGAVTAAQGNSTITVTPTNTGVNAAELTLTSLSRTAGATLNITAGGGTLGQLGFANNPRVFITNALTGSVAPIGLADNQIIPGVVLGGDLTSYNATTGIGALGQAGFPAYNTATLNTLGAISTANYNGNGAVLAGGQTINALKPNGAITFVSSGDILTLTSGMVASSGQAFGTTSVRGGLTSATSELILHSNGGNTTVNSVVSGANKLVLAGGGTYTLTAANSQTGGTTVNGGTLALTNNALATPLVVSVPNATTAADGLVLNGATATLTNSPGQIGSSNIVTLSGNSTLNLFGNNTLAGLVLNHIGQTAPVVNTTPSAFGATANSTGITLTLTGGITSTTNNIRGIAQINGRVALPATSTLDIGAATFNTLIINPIQADLIVNGLSGGGTTITKSGTGMLQFNQPTTITGSLAVTAGGLQIGAAGAGARLANVVLSDGTRINMNNFAGTFGSLATTGTGTGLVTNTGTSTVTLTTGFSNASTTFAGSFQRFNDSTINLINLTTIGTGTMTLTGNTSTASGTLTVNSTSGGGVSFKDAGLNNFLQNAITVTAGGTLTLDDSGIANLSNRLGNVGVTLSGGSFVSTANAAGSTETTTGALTLNTGESTVTLNQGAVSNVTTFGSLGGLGTGSSATFAGTGIGTATNKLVLTGAPGLTNNILPRLAVGTDFATYNQNGAGVANTNGIQAVTAYSAATN